MGKTLFEKVWEQHVVDTVPGGREILYIDQHFIHEVTSPQAFAGLRQRKIGLARTEQTLATADHNVPTKDQDKPITDELSRTQVQTLTQNCHDFGVELYGLGNSRQGIVHVIGPELGVTKPGMTIVCGDSHTSTHGAFGAIAFGIGTSQVEQVFATQCLLTDRPKKMRITIDGSLDKGVTSKDIILYIIAQISAAGGTGHFVEFAGSAIRELSMEARMSICNMSIEMGARGGLIAPDKITYDYMKGRPEAPVGNNWDNAMAYWETLFTDEDASFDKEFSFHADDIKPMVTYGTNPGMGIGVDESIPDEAIGMSDQSFQKSLEYMNLSVGQKMIGLPIEYVFIGSCTNSRIEDLRLVADYVKGKKVHTAINAMVVPGSQEVRQQAIEEGIDKVLREAGFDFREPGCSACLGMNEDKVPAGKYCVSTSNRNFEGRQGPGARTILASPLTAAAAAIAGKIVDVRKEIV